MHQLRALRKAAGLSTQKVADHLGYRSASAVTMWETGMRKVPSNKLVALSGLYGCTIDELLSPSKETETCPRAEMS